MTTIDHEGLMKSGVYLDAAWLGIFSIASKMVHIYIPLFVIAYYGGKIGMQWLEYIKYKKQLPLVGELA